MKNNAIYITNLLDFAEDLVERLESEEADDDKGQYFMSLIYIEDIVDIYGRGFALREARAAGQSEQSCQELLGELHRRLDKLRQAIERVALANDFEKVIEAKVRHFSEEWPMSLYTRSSKGGSLVD